jgi:hypothetical protein
MTLVYLHRVGTLAAKQSPPIEHSRESGRKTHHGIEKEATKSSATDVIPLEPQPVTGREFLPPGR